MVVPICKTRDGSLSCRIENASKTENRPLSYTTDGLENASQHFTAEAVRKLISNAQENSGWKFVFYGADFDVVKTARQYGIDEADAVRFRKDAAGMRELRVARSKKLKDFLN